MRSVVSLLGSLVLAGSQISAGVVIEMTSGDPATVERAGTDTIYAQGEMLRMEESGEPSSILFREDTLWIIDADANECRSLDRAGMERLSAGLRDAMAQVEQQLAQLPPEQREKMLETLRKRVTPGRFEMLTGNAPERRIEAGAMETVGVHSCKAYTLYSGDAKVWEVCAAPDSELGDGATEARRTFDAMSLFAETLRTAFLGTFFERMMDSPFQDMDRIDGFPVRLRTFDGETVEKESVLKSIVQEELEADLFSLPSDCKVNDIANAK